MSLNETLRAGKLDLTLPPWPGDPFARRNRLFAVRYDGSARAGCYFPVLRIAIARPGRYCTVDRTPGLFLRWFELRLPHISWRLGYKLRAVGGIRAYCAVERFYRRLG